MDHLDISIENLSLFRKGDHFTFSQIYSQYSVIFQRYIYSKVHDSETAQELTQEAFIKIYRFREKYDPKYPFLAWAWTIVKNTVVDYTRSQEKTHSFEDTENLPSLQKDAESIVIGKSERKHLFKLMRSLTKLQKKVLWMRIIHHLSYQEISKALGLSLASVKNLAYRAKLSLDSFTKSESKLVPFIEPHPVASS